MAGQADDIAGQLGAFFQSRGCQRAEVGLLQPADPFLDIAGEDIRRRMFLTNDQAGKSFCLRPEFTIPVGLDHVNKGKIPVRYGYAGTVFRQRDDEPHEFIQAGIEDLGNENRVEADIACIADAEQALRQAGANELSILMGDQAVFKALLLALGLPKAWRERLGREFGDREKLQGSLAGLTGPRADPYEGLPEDLVAFIASDEAEAVTGWVAEKMRDSGLPLSRGRTADAIASRLMDKVELASVHLSSEQKAALEAFLSIEASIDEAIDRLGEFEAEHSLKLGPCLETLTARLSGLAAHGLDGSRVRYQSAFGRRLDYYTGLVFEIYPGNDTGEKPLAGGGRYDRLMSMLGSETTIPAVGFSIWVDRLAREVEAS